MWRISRFIVRSLAVVLLVALAMPVMGATSHAATFRATGSPVGVSAEWQSIDATTFQHASLANTFFTYIEHDLASLAVPDNRFLIEVATVMEFREVMEVDALPQLGTSNPAADPLWYVHAMDMDGVSYVVLFAVSVTAVPGKGAVEILLTTPESLAAALPAAQQITVHGQPGLVARIEAGAVPAVLSGQAPAPVAATTPAPPAGSSAGTVTVGSDTVAFGGEWRHSAEGSGPQMAIFSHASNAEAIVAYAVIAEEAGIDLQAALDFFAWEIFEAIGAIDEHVVNMEVLPSGKAWSLHTIDVSGTRTVLLAVGGPSSTPGMLGVELLIVPADQVGPLLASAQQAFQVNGARAFSEIDAEDAHLMVNGGLPFSVDVPTGTAAAPTASTSGQADDYQALDAPAGCDGIGWVITSASQAPVTQADLDHRGACVGGATYVADCGLYAMQATPLVYCTVYVSVGDAPMRVSVNHFSVVDAAGNVFPVDTESLYLMLMLLGGTELPEAVVDPGASVSGTLLFYVPVDAPGPWVIQVAPETIATTGEAPGKLVIDAELQPVDLFAQ